MARMRRGADFPYTDDADCMFCGRIFRGPHKRRDHRTLEERKAYLNAHPELGITTTTVCDRPACKEKEADAALMLVRRRHPELSDEQWTSVREAYIRGAPNETLEAERERAKGASNVGGDE